MAATRHQPPCRTAPTAATRVKTQAKTMSNRPEGAARWPEHLPVGALRFGRSSAHYDQTVRFYRDLGRVSEVGGFYEMFPAWDEET